MPRTILIEDPNGETSVLLDAAGDDHIAIKHTIDANGYERDITLPSGTFAWERAVELAMRGVVFL